MNLLTLGLNHRSAPLDLRGRFAFTLDQLTPRLHGLRERLHHAPGHPEVAMLSTCNRTELYCAAGSGLERPALDWLAAMGGISLRQLMEHAYVLEGDAAVRHVFRVASGLDSMMLGESQILGQLKSAVRQAELAGTLGKTLNQLFQRSFTAAKEVRSRTEIGAHSVSLAAAVARLVRQSAPRGDASRVLLVGAGDMIEKVAVHLSAQAPRVAAVANRSLERALQLADRIGAQAMSLPDLPRRLAGFDVVISCTASAQPVIDLDAVQRAMKARQDHPMLLIDLAVPRDIAAEAGQLNAVRLVTIDDMAAMVEAAGLKRRAALEQAEVIVEDAVLGFRHWLDQQASVPLVQALNQQADRWRTIALARARKSLARGDSVEQVIEALSQGLTRKMLHGALTELQGSSGEQRMQLTGTLSRLFLECPVRNPLLGQQAETGAAELDGARRPGNVVPMPLPLPVEARRAAVCEDQDLPARTGSTH